jgi:mono/diheme cytochrome c family protein
MKNNQIACLALIVTLTGCSKQASVRPSLTSKIQGTQIVEVSGEKQIAGVGSKIADPIVVQVNGADGNALAGALVVLRGDGLVFTPTEALTDASGQVSAAVQLGGIPGNYEIVAETPKAGGGTATVSMREAALGYQAKLGKEISDKYCRSCHDPESTPERVSNFDNLTPPQPHQFSDGNTLNNWSDADLIKVIAEGGPALGKSPQTPAYRNTLTTAQVKAVVTYIRAVSDPPYQPPALKR